MKKLLEQKILIIKIMERGLILQENSKYEITSMFRSCPVNVNLSTLNQYHHFDVSFLLNPLGKITSQERYQDILVKHLEYLFI